MAKYGIAMFLRRQTDIPGVSLAIVYSVFQKCIRRGDAPHALYYGRRIYEYGTPNAMRKRLLQCVLEDMAHWQLALDVFALGSAPSWEDCAHMVAVLCANKKTHITAYLSRLAVEPEFERPVFLPAAAWERVRELSALHIADDHKAVRAMMDATAGKMYVFMGKSRLVWMTYTLSQYLPECNYDYLRDVPMPHEEPFDAIPRWAMDKHVPGGTKGYAFFFEHGLVLENRLFGELEDLLKEQCLDVYMQHGGVNTAGRICTVAAPATLPRLTEQKNDALPPELDEYADVIQVQLLTRRGHPKVYFCRLKGAPYVLKGPMGSGLRDKIMLSERMKVLLGLPQCDAEVIGTFIRWRSLCDYDSQQYIIRESKLEGPRRIYTGPNAHCDPETMDLMGLCRAVMFKNLVGADDWAARNFLEDSAGVIYSIDDHAKMAPITTMIPSKFKRQHREAIVRFIVENVPALLDEAAEWRIALVGRTNNMAPMLARLDELEELLRSYTA